MKTIQKFDLQPVVTRIEIPADARILAIMVQGIYPRLFVLLDEDAPKAKRAFVTYKTGANVPDNPGKYVGSFCYSGDVTLSLHVFEVKEGDEVLVC